MLFFTGAFSQSIGKIERSTKFNNAAFEFEDAAGSGSVYKGGSEAISKPNQLHHFATNKNKTYTLQLEKVANKYDLNLNDSWNKEMLPHQGRHPNEYHEYVLDSIKQFDEIAQGNKDVFLKLYDGLKKNISSIPEMLYKDYWK